MLRRCLLLALLAIATGAPAAQAVTLGGTVLLDRPTGFGALPFDGIANSSVSLSSMTPDGRYVVFTSASNALLAGDEDSATNVYRVDLTTGAVVQVNTSASGAQPTPGSESENASISADGNYVGFITTAPTLNPAAGPASRQFVVKDLSTGALELASRANGPGGAPVANLQFGVLSGDGRHVAFTASSAVQADNATGVPGTTDAYLRSLDTNVTHMESVTTPGGTEAGGVREAPGIDYGGDAVSFSTINKLVASDTDERDDAYVHIASPDQTLLASFSSGQTPGAEEGDDAAVAGGPGSLYLAWGSSQAEWIAPCTTTCATAATRIDHERTGGTDSNSNKLEPFFPAPASAALPAWVYWGDYDGLDPADTNDRPDIYGWNIGNNNFDTSIRLMTGAPTGGTGSYGSATDDGSLAAFSSSAAGLPGANGAVDQAYVRRAGVDTNISQPIGQPPRTDGAGNAEISPDHALSDDGREIAFYSLAPALGAGVGPSGFPAGQILVRDVVNGATQLASVSTDGATGGNDDSREPSIDAAGDRVVFSSSASNLVPGDTNSATDVFMRDLSTGTTTLVDRTAGGGSPLGGAFEPEISADGTKVAYISRSTEIPGGASDGSYHAYEVDLGTGNVTLIDRNAAGEPGNDSAFSVDLDGDGKRATFVSGATNLGGSSHSVYVRDLTEPAHPTTTWVSVPQDAIAAHDSAESPSIDRDGGQVAFVESNPEFGFGMTAHPEVFVRNLGAQTTTLASTGPAGPANAYSVAPSLSANGSRVSFYSAAENLPGAIPDYGNVFVRDLASTTTVLGSTRDGTSSSGRFGAEGGSLSGNGACLAFGSTSDDLVSGGYGSDFRHIFLHALSSDCPSESAHAAPTISHFSLTHRRFAVGGKPTALSSGATDSRKGKKVPRGTAFRFKLSEAAVTRIAIVKALRGHRAAKHNCKSAKNRQKRNCTVTVTLLTLTRAHTRQGSNEVPFSGRYAKKRLPKGTYTAIVTATDAAGNRSKPRSARFSVVAGR